MNNNKQKIIMAMKRAAWTMAEVLVAMMGADLLMVTEYDWKRIVGVCISAGILSLAKSIIAGMPEHDDVTIYEREE